VGDQAAASGEYVELTVKVPRERLAPYSAVAVDPIAHAERLLRNIRMRAEFFPELKAADPGWTIMLDLLVQESRGKVVSIQSACLASGAPATTALRHLATLVEKGETVRTPDTADGRRCFVSLSAAAKARLLVYLSISALPP
jgi:Fic family protein